MAGGLLGLEEQAWERPWLGIPALPALPLPGGRGGELAARGLSGPAHGAQLGHTAELLPRDPAWAGVPPPLSSLEGNPAPRALREKQMARWGLEQSRGWGWKVPGQ